MATNTDGLWSECREQVIVGCSSPLETFVAHLLQQGSGNTAEEGAKRVKELQVRGSVCEMVSSEPLHSGTHIVLSSSAQDRDKNKQAKIPVPMMSEPELPSSAVTAITDDCSGSHQVTRREEWVGRPST